MKREAAEEAETSQDKKKRAVEPKCDEVRVKQEIRLDYLQNKSFFGPFLKTTLYSTLIKHLHPKILKGCPCF